MKKNMFEKWYNRHGKEFAKKCYPIDENDDKVLRKEAKKIFDSIYRLYSAEMTIRLENVQVPILKELEIIEDDFRNTLTLKNNWVEKSKELTSITTELYDLHNEKKIDDSYFNKMSKYYGEKLSFVKSTITNIDSILKEIKRTKKEIDSLIIS